MEIIKVLTSTTTLIKKRIGIGYKNYEKQCSGLEFEFSWTNPKRQRGHRTYAIQPRVQRFAAKLCTKPTFQSFLIT